ncbi:hypothetical protein BPAE_0019g00440 [Botrytis paeoniae]|uniref:Uncharacterized protein n=1 Tax=Botrytis paeoniae TaxID=278948 RepID=A0A4Z1G257_9HELO|nr:hypothetical protein BPAE_0019g00440 [Botrytis paeoniae]
MYAAGTVALRMNDGEVCVCRRNEEREKMTADVKGTMPETPFPLPGYPRLALLAADTHDT